MNSLVYLLSALSFVVFVNSLGFYHCQPCSGDECNVKPGECKYGITKDPCGRWKCMAGPGQRCGGRDNHLGRCGEGMSCECGKCRGCSSDMLERGILDCTKSTMPICS